MVGGIAFLAGIVIAVLSVFLTGFGNYLLVALVILGVLIGILNIADQEATPFLMSGAVLIIASSFGKDVLGSVVILGDVLNALLVLFVPATIVVAIRNVFSLARN